MLDDAGSRPPGKKLVKSKKKVKKKLLTYLPYFYRFLTVFSPPRGEIDDSPFKIFVRWVIICPLGSFF